MKAIMPVLFLFAFLNEAIAQESKYAKSSYKTEAEKNEFILYLAKKFNTNALDILSYAEKPREYTHYVDGSSHMSQLINYSTVVHEMCHGANFDIAHFEYQGLYITPDIKLKILKGPVYKSNQLNKFVPKDQQKEIFRYSIYIRGTTDRGIRIPFLASVSEGIYGLLNEFTAYYQGVHAALEIYPHVKAAYGVEDYEPTVKFLQHQASEIYAYHEFRLFMAWYVHFAEKKHPDVYKGCVENQDLKVAISLVDQLYLKTIEDYKRLRQSLVDDINTVGKVKASIDEKGGIKISKGGGSSTSWGGPEETINYLESLLTDEYRASLAKLYIPEVTLENYKKFLK